MSVALLSMACVSLDRDPQSFYAKVVYDLAEGDIPLPNDVVRNVAEGHLDLPIDDGMSDAEARFRTWLNTRDAWSSASGVHFSTNLPLDPTTLTAESVRVWEWGTAPQPLSWNRSEDWVDDPLALTLTSDGLDIALDAPRGGWTPGGDYVVALVGGASGLRTTDGLPVGPDAGMYYLLQEEPLDDPADQRAFPGDTRAERIETGARLEAIRQTLAPALDHLVSEGVPREDLAAVWRFSVTKDVELAMDKASQRMPVPFDLLVDPETGKVDLTPAPWDDELQADAKEVANRLDGFGVSANLLFEFTGDVDPETLDVALYDLSATPAPVGVTSRVMTEDGDCAKAGEGCRFAVIEIDPDELPLKPATTYGLVVRNGLLGATGMPVQRMPIGALLLGDDALFDGSSQLSALDDEDASRLEGVRGKIDLLLDDVGRDDVLAAWPFTTLDAVPDLRAAANLATTVGEVHAPIVDDVKPAYDLLFDDALDDLFPGVLNPGPAFYLERVDGVAAVVEGRIPMPQFLDPESRRWRKDSAYELEDVAFWAMVPEHLDPDKPVVIFGHAIVTDRRFLTMIAGELARNGFASVSIDFPYHGERIACVDASLVAVPNFLPDGLRQITGLTDNLLWFPPCESGPDATCSPSGQCLDASGHPDAFSTFPIIDLKPAGGAAFLDTNDIPHIPDHFAQALSDLGALRASLQTQDWTYVFGQETPSDRVHYVGMSLGAIIGVVWVAVTPEVERAVFNVPGGSLVDLFRDSTFFGPQIEATFADLGVDVGTHEEERLLDVARWLVDSVDPHSVAHLYEEEGRVALIQMDQVAPGIGDLVIPNYTTERLQRASGLPIVAYPSVLHGDLVIPLVGDGILDHAVQFLETGNPP